MQLPDPVGWVERSEPSRFVSERLTCTFRDLSKRSLAPVQASLDVRVQIPS